MFRRVTQDMTSQGNCSIFTHRKQQQSQIAKIIFPCSLIVQLGSGILSVLDSCPLYRTFWFLSTQRESLKLHYIPFIEGCYFRYVNFQQRPGPMIYCYPLIKSCHIKSLYREIINEINNIQPFARKAEKSQSCSISHQRSSEINQVLTKTTC